MIIAPVMPPDPPKNTVQRFRKQGYFMVCEICGFAIDYCKGHALGEFGAGDGTDSDLSKRIKDAQQVGGR